MDHEVDRVLGLVGRVKVAVAAVECFDRDPDVGREDWSGEGKETWSELREGRGEAVGQWAG
jgi:hypothetical protein